MTTLHDLRTFLSTLGAAPAARPAAAVARVYGLVCARRDDPSFWSALRVLLGRFDDPAFRPAPLGYRILDPAAAGTLIDALRDALPTSPTPVRLWARGVRSVGALAAFALLVTGCTGEPKETGDGICAEASEHALSGDEAEVYCDLLEIVDGSGLDESGKAALHNCLHTLPADERESLLAYFQSASDEDLLAKLTELAESSCGQDGGDDGGDDGGAH